MTRIDLGLQIRSIMQRNGLRDGAAIIHAVMQQVRFHCQDAALSISVLCF